MYRKLLDNPILYKPNYMAIWTYLLLKANHKDTHMIWNNKKTTIKKGSLITSIRGISKLFRISTGSVTFILKYLISEHMIEQESNAKFTILTIKNYNNYQDVEHKVENQRDTGETLAELNKNDKNVKNDKNLVTKVTSGELIEKPQDEINFLIGLFKPVNPSYERLFANLSQRKAVERLVGKYGLQKIENAIRSLPLIVNRPYAPTITTPTQLESKLGDLSVFVRKEQAKQVKNSYEKL